MTTLKWCHAVRIAFARALLTLESSLMPKPINKFFETGTVADEIHVEISFEIIGLFSEGLYSSPNKAIEELVSNLDSRTWAVQRWSAGGRAGLWLVCWVFGWVRFVTLVW